MLIPSHFFFGGGLGWSRVDLHIRWSPVLWLNLQMAGRRGSLKNHPRLGWSFLKRLFFSNLNTTGCGGKFSTKKKLMNEMMNEIDDWNWWLKFMIEIDDVWWRLMKHKFVVDFLQKQIFSSSSLKNGGALDLATDIFVISAIFWWLDFSNFAWFSARFRTRRMKPCLIHTRFQKTLVFLKWLNLPIRLQMLGDGWKKFTLEGLVQL